MGANTTVYVRVLRTHKDWLEVNAVTLEEAEEIARRSYGVVAVLGSTYADPNESGRSEFLRSNYLEHFEDQK
jgi:hypothetical protein